MSKNAANDFVARRERNLKYFHKHYPDVYMFFADYKMQRYQLNILPESGELDLLGPEGSLYQDAGKAFAIKEVETFRSVFSKGKELQTVAPLSAHGLVHPRFMHQRLREMVEPFQEGLDALEGYSLEFFPMLVFLGVGLGLHIEEMLAQERVQNVIVAEADPDFFAVSLYTVDWVKICEKFRFDRGQSIHFIVGMTGKEADIFPELWNTLIRHCPVYPVGTMFYTHRGSENYNQVADRINNEMNVFLASWGHYDDEIRQLNNALHTFHLKVPLLPEKLDQGLDIPVFLVGNGPSLDARIEQIRQSLDKAIVVSCGTALRSLLEYGVEPDFHVELESDFMTFQVLDAIDHAKLSKLRLIAPTHICPLIFTLFGESRIYFKQENCIPQFFADGRHIIEKGVPTCVNAAIAVFLAMGFKNLFLYGMDFGYRDETYHHSKKSIYMAEDKGDIAEIASFGTRHDMQIEAWDGSPIFTTYTFFSTKRMVERLTEDLSNSQSDQKVFCCSDGARIEHTYWLADEEMRNLFDQVPVAGKENAISQLFATEAPELDLGTVERRIAEADDGLKRACRHIGRLVKGTELNSLWDLSCLCSRINNFMEFDVGQKSLGLYYLIRGTMRHFTFIGLTYSWSIRDPERRKAFITQWRITLEKALEALPGHFERVTRKHFELESDPWVRQSINHQEVFSGETVVNQ